MFGDPINNQCARVLLNHCLLELVQYNNYIYYHLYYKELFIAAGINDLSDPGILEGGSGPRKGRSVEIFKLTSKKQIIEVGVNPPEPPGSPITWTRTLSHSHSIPTRYCLLPLGINPQIYKLDENLGLSLNSPKTLYNRLFELTQIFLHRMFNAIDLYQFITWILLCYCVRRISTPKVSEYARIKTVLKMQKPQGSKAATYNHAQSTGIQIQVVLDVALIQKEHIASPIHNDVIVPLLHLYSHIF